LKIELYSMVYNFILINVIAYKEINQ